MGASIEAWTGAGYTGTNAPPGPTDFTIPAGVPPPVRGIGDVWVDNSQVLLSWDVGWLTPVLLNGWVNYGGWQTVRYRKLLSGMVAMEGLVKSGTIGATVFTLPPGYRPVEGKVILVVFGEVNPSRLDVLDTGAVIIVAPATAGYVSLTSSFWPDA